MSDFGEGKWVVARKPHRCEACYGLIPKGECHYCYHCTEDGSWQNWRMHEECFKFYEFDGFEEFVSGELPVPSRLRSPR